MFPGAFLQRIRLQQYIDYELLIQGLSAAAPVSVRINPQKWNGVPLRSEPVAWCRSGFYPESRPSFTLDPLFHAGCYYPQEASGMFIEEVFRQVAGDIKNLRVLDLCAAPGGKSTHLSSLIGREGLLVANEVIGSRAAVLAENVTKWGVSNTIVTRSDPSAFAQLPGFFDIMLVDAPCSGEGMFSNPQVRTEWSPENAALCSERQKRILMDVWPALKEDGILIYCTCTFNPDENENNISWFLRNSNAESVRIDISQYNGITEIEYEGIHGYGFYPGRIKGEGLFISVIRKRDKTGNRLPKYKFKRHLALNREERLKACEISDFAETSLIKSGDEVISVPGAMHDYLLLSGNLRIIKHGTSLFSVKAKDFIPSHELALSVFMKINVYNTLNLNYEQALSYLRRENPEVSGPAGWMLVRYNGTNLGFMKNIGSRINNYYPVEWRIRMNPTGSEGKNVLNWMDHNH